MALKDDNYWGRTKRTPSTQKQIQAPPSEILNEKIDPAILRKLTSNANLMTVPSNPITRILSTNPDTQFTGGPAGPFQSGASPFDALAAPVTSLNPSVVESLKGTASSVLDAFGGMFDGMFKSGGNEDSAGADESPEAIYNRLREQAGQYSYNGPSAEEMAAKQFDPQFALLDSLRKQTDSRYKQNKADITGMYRGLVDSATEGRASDQANFKGATETIGKNYKQATDNLTGSSSAYSQAMAQQLAQLGIKEGTGDVVAGVGKNLQDNVARLNQQGTVSQDLLTNLGANEYAFDTRNIGTAKQAGVNTQEQFLNDYMDRLAGQDQQRLQLTGQRGQAENQYDMQIQDLLQKGQAAQGQNINDTLKSILQGNQQNTDNYFKQAGLNLDLSKFDWARDPSNPANMTKSPTSNPYDTLSQRALQAYGGDENKARDVVNAIISQYQQDPNAATVGDFLSHIENQDSLKNDPNLTPLIFDFINQMLAQKK